MNFFLGIGIVWFIILGILAWKRPLIALFCVLAGTHLFLLRFEIFGIPATVLEFGIYGFVLGGIARGLQNNHTESFMRMSGNWLQRVWNMWKWYIPALAIWLIPTLIAGLDGGARGMGIVKAWFFDPIVLALVIGSLASQYKSTDIKKSMGLGMLVSAIIMSVYGLFGYAASTTPERLSSYFETPNYVTMYLVPLLFLAGAVVWEQRQKLIVRWRNSVYWIIMALFFARVLQLTDSYGGFVALTLGALFFCICMPVRWKWKGGILAICVLIIVGTFQFRAISLSGHYNSFFKVDSVSMRKELWRGALYLIETDYRQPWLGVGLGQFQQSFWRLYHTGPADLFTLPYYLLDFHLPHNLYLTIAGETGKIALFGFLLFIGLWLWRVGTAFYRTKDIFLLAALCAMIAILVHGFFDTPYFKNDLSVLFWMIVVVGALPDSLIIHERVK